LPKLPNWSRQIEADPDFLDPFQPEIPLLSEFGVTLGNVFRRVTGPEVPRSPKLPSLFCKKCDLLKARVAKQPQSTRVEEPSLLCNSCGFHTSSNPTCRSPTGVSQDLGHHGEEEKNGKKNEVDNPLEHGGAARRYGEKTNNEGHSE